MLCKTGTLLVPANPSRGRIIRDGRYFVDGIPLNEPAFARDPEHPPRSSSVAEMLGDASGILAPDAGDLARPAVLRQLAWHRLTVPHSTAPGIGVVLPAGRDQPHIFIKPGSYDWPSQNAGGGRLEDTASSRKQWITPRCRYNAALP